MEKVVWNLSFALLKSPIGIICIIGILGLLGIISYKKIIGKAGEKSVAQVLSKLPNREYIVLNNVMISGEDEKTHQIDHIVFSRYGIFVVETKTFSGLIKGDVYQKQWTQILGRTKNSFYNPTHQNYGHIKALENILNIPEKKFISIVCFANTAKLDIENGNNVINISKINEKIREYKVPIINDDINELVDIITNNKKIDFNRNSKHVRTIKNTMKENEEKVQKGICPKCGGKLVERNGKYGPFLGCSNYPNCKYIEKKWGRKYG